VSAAEVTSAGGSVFILDRPVLAGLLEAGADTQITAVVAPAGSGKTVLVRSWAASRASSERTAWVSVERGERDPQRFWSALATEVIRAATLGTGVDVIAPSPAFNAEAVVARLTRELTTLRRRLTVVIDDVHEIKSVDIMRQLTQLLDGLPGAIRVVLISRHDPQLGLHRRRLDGDVTEIRIDQLRFTIDESRQLLAAVGITLSDGALRLLQSRTEGWVAGLRLAALSLATHPDPERFVLEFSGSERTVAEYLIAEVLDSQPPDVRRLLVHTSILDRVNGALGDLLTGDAGTVRHLSALADSGSFVIRLDGHGEWFRFHHLFADLLVAQLRHSEAAAIPGLHLLAADWYIENGHVVEAITHALATDDRDLATSLLVEHYFSLLMDGRQATARLLVERAAGRAPAAELAVLQAADELINGSLDHAAAQLALAERRSADVPDDRKPRFELLLYMTRLALAGRVGDFHSILGAAKPPALSGEPENAHDLSTQTDVRAWGLMNLGVVEVWTGRLDDGERHLLEAEDLARQIRRPYLQVSCLAHRAQSTSWRSPVLARPVALEALAIAERNGLHDDPVAGVAHVALGSCLLAAGDVVAAEQEFRCAEQTLRCDVHPAVGFKLQTGHGLIHLVNARYRDAVNSFLEAERLGKSLVVSSPLALQARCAMLYCAVLAGDDILVEEALGELTEHERDTGEVREVIAARSIAQGDPAAAVAILEAKLDESPLIYRDMTRIRSLLLNAKSHYLLGDDMRGRESMERALDLAEVDVLVLPFLWVDSSELLERHHRHQTAHGAFLTVIRDVLAGRHGGVGRQRPGSTPVELSDTELRVLRYLPTNLKVGEIAAEIYLSANTIKTHLRSIYSKLDAHSRSQAVEYARDLGLVGRAAHSR
jgi:LuxR family transcriptional regulator, maltose regulon positive regulatory protein